MFQLVSIFIDVSLTALIHKPLINKHNDSGTHVAHYKA